LGRVVEGKRKKQKIGKRKGKEMGRAAIPILLLAPVCN